MFDVIYTANRVTTNTYFYGQMTQYCACKFGLSEKEKSRDVIQFFLSLPHLKKNK